MLVPSLSFVLLLVGLVVRLKARPARSFRGPAWKTSEAFETREEYVRYLVGTVMTLIGGFLLIVSALTMP